MIPVYPASERNSQRVLLGDLDRHATALVDALEFGWRHGPGLQHHRGRDDAAVAGARGELGIEVCRIHVVEGVRPVADHRRVHRVRCARACRPHRFADERIEALAQFVFGVVGHFVVPFISSSPRLACRGVRAA